jgi:hypothetical protein
MSLSYKILGQLATLGADAYPSSGYGYYYGFGDNNEGSGYATIYTVPESTETTVTTISVTNFDTSVVTYDLAIVPAGETLATVHHFRWDMQIAAGDFDLITAKITLSVGDKIMFLPSDVDKVGITVFGVEKENL